MKERTTWDMLIGPESGSDYAYVHTQVENDYWHAVLSAKPSGSTPRSLFRAHLQVIIWGCLALEGQANTRLYEVVASQVDAAVLEDYWKLVERMELWEKIQRVLKHHALAAEWDNLQARLKVEVKFRNRLVHFKDVPQRINLRKVRQKWETAGRPGELLEHVPHAGIVAELLAVPLDERRDFYLALGKLLGPLGAGRFGAVGKQRILQPPT